MEPFHSPSIPHIDAIHSRRILGSVCTASQARSPAPLAGPVPSSRMSITQPPLPPLTTSPSTSTNINATTATAAGHATAARLSNIVTGHYSDHQQATESRPPNSGTSTSTAAGSATATSAVSTEHPGGHLHPPTHQQHQPIDHQLPHPPPPPPTQPQPQPQQESSTISLPSFHVDAHPTILAAAATAAAAHHHASANHDDHQALQSALVVAPNAVGQAPPQPSIEPGNVANPQPYPPEAVAMYAQALPMASQTPSPASATTPKPQSRTTRLRRACDLCSSRKVKVKPDYPDLFTCLYHRADLLLSCRSVMRLILVGHVAIFRSTVPSTGK